MPRSDQGHAARIKLLAVGLIPCGPHGHDAIAAVGPEWPSHMLGSGLLPSVSASTSRGNLVFLDAALWRRLGERAVITAGLSRAQSPSFGFPR